MGFGYAVGGAAEWGIFPADGVDAFLDSVEFEIGVGWGFEFLVGEDFGLGRVVDGVELDLVEVGDFAEFFGDADLVAAVFGLESRTRDGDVFVVIYGEVSAFAVAGA